MEEAIKILMSPKSNESEKQKARKALFRGFLGDFAKSEERSKDAKPEAVRGHKILEYGTEIYRNRRDANRC